MPRGPSSLELMFDQLWNENFPEIDLLTEQKLIPGRRYSFDYYHPESKTAVEVSGQTWRIGGHSSGSGIARDYEKSNLAILNGYKTFQLTKQMVNLEWLTKIAEYIKAKS